MLHMGLGELSRFGKAMNDPQCKSHCADSRGKTEAVQAPASRDAIQLVLKTISNAHDRQLSQ